MTNYALIDAEAPLFVVLAKHKVLGVKGINLYPDISKRFETEALFHECGVKLFAFYGTALDEQTVAHSLEIAKHLISSVVPKECYLTGKIQELRV